MKQVIRYMDPESGVWVAARSLEFAPDRYVVGDFLVEIGKQIELGDKFFEIDTRKEITVISGPHRDYFPAMTPQSDSVYLISVELGEKIYHQLMSEDDLLKIRRSAWSPS